MNQFYVSIIFTGIILIIIALAWIVIDWKKTSDDRQIVDKKKDEITEIVSGADQMIDEMNKFSDYIVDFMETRSEHMENKVKEIEEKLQEIDKAIQRKAAGIVQKNESNILQVTGTDDIAATIEGSDISDIHKYIKKEKNSQRNQSNTNNRHIKADGEKVIHLTPKCKEVMELAEDGLSDIEIAKRMNIGKGEVQLILGINK